MTDKEKLTKVLTEFGVGFEEDGTDVICREGKPKIDGYCFFFTRFRFDETGKFVDMGSYE